MRLPSLEPTRAGVLRLAVIIMAVALIAGITLVIWPSGGTKTATAYFPRALSIFPQSDVTVLGVRVGSVDSVEPVGESVKVVFHYDEDQKIPADAFAVLLAPTLVSDRVVQLGPVYKGGPVLRDGAVLPLSRTRIPLELDEIAATLHDLTEALGPEGANSDGALARLIEVGADNLEGNGESANRTIRRVSELTRTLSDNREALFGTVRNLQSFTTVLAQHDGDTRTFLTELEKVSAQLDAEREAFSTAIRELGVALGEVAGFVKDNKAALSADIASLAKVSTVLDRQKELLGALVDIGATGISNYSHMYTPSARTFNSRFNEVITANPAVFICQIYSSVGGAPEECLRILEPLKSLPLPGAPS